MSREPSAMPAVRALHKLAAFSDASAANLRKLEKGQRDGGVAAKSSYRLSHTIIQFLRAYRALNETERVYVDKIAHQLSCGRDPTNGALVGEPFGRNLWSPSEIERVYGKWFDGLSDRDRLGATAVMMGVRRAAKA